MYVCMYVCMCVCRRQQERTGRQYLISVGTKLVHNTVIARVIRKPQFRLLRPWLGDCGCGDDVSTVEEKDAEILLAKEKELAGPTVPSPHWKPNATFRMAVDFTPYPKNQVPPLVARRLRLHGRDQKYLPVMYVYVSHMMLA